DLRGLLSQVLRRFHRSFEVTFFSCLRQLQRSSFPQLELSAVIFSHLLLDEIDDGLPSLDGWLMPTLKSAQRCVDRLGNCLFVLLYFLQLSKRMLEQFSEKLIVLIRFDRNRFVFSQLVEKLVDQLYLLLDDDLRNSLLLLHPKLQ